MIRNLLIIIACLFALPTFADNKTAIAFYKTGESDIAKQLFKKQLNSSATEKAEALYYLGEIAFNAGNTSKALDYYKQGWETSPQYAYNQVGQGKILLKTDTKAAEKAFGTATKINKKDAAVYVAIAAAYAANNMPDDTKESLEDARKFNTNEPAIYLFEGDQLLAQDKPGDAAGKYELALHFNPDCLEAYIKYADVYKGVSPALSIEMLQKALTRDPNYLPAYRSLGDIYSLQGMYVKAIDAYKKYMNGELYTTDNLIHYASALFFNGQYAEAAQIIEQGKAKEPNNFLLKRLSFYNKYETKDYQHGVKESIEFFNAPDAKIIWQDYLYYGRLLGETEQYDQALEALQKALDLCEPNSHPEIYKDIADVSTDKGDYDNAIKAYSKYMEITGTSVETSDFYQLGKYYYTAATKDSIVDTGYLGKADSLFNIVKERVPNSHLGTLWQARTQALMDPETEQGLAKPYYEACIQILEKTPGKYTKDLSECYRYLGYYYYLKEDMDNSKLYWNKILEIDPANQTALEALKNIK